ncbi:MAG: hypothetical protein D3920_14110 [Candidatus Electrothrix sp. AW2]|nr:hypothetical protein [Candidatus Electrothrix gigas]
MKLTLRRCKRDMGHMKFTLRQSKRDLRRGKSALRCFNRETWYRMFETGRVKLVPGWLQWAEKGNKLHGGWKK